MFWKCFQRKRGKIYPSLKFFSVFPFLLSCFIVVKSYSFFQTQEGNVTRLPSDPFFLTAQFVKFTVFCRFLLALWGFYRSDTAFNIVEWCAVLSEALQECRFSCTVAAQKSSIWMSMACMLHLHVCKKIQMGLRFYAHQNEIIGYNGI